MKLQHTNNTSKVWAGVIAALLLIALAVTLTGCGGEKIAWNDIVLGEMLPTPPNDKGEIHTNSRENLLVCIYDITEKQFADYLEECKKKGFTIDAESSSTSYNAFNDKGYKLRLYYTDSNSEMNIDVDPPIEMATITWPTSQAGRKLPVPHSTTGKFSYEHDDKFFVYIGNTTKADYSAYVAACSDMGFSVNYKKGEDYYFSDNAEGWHVDIRYVGNNVITISIKAPTKDTESTVTTAVTTAVTTSEQSPSETKDAATDSIDPTFKTSMDAYETFMSEYVDFMKKYKENPSNLTLLASYADYMSKYANFIRDFKAWENKELNNAELAYYIDVQARVNKKLLEIAG